ncbi:ABC transporter ATP-binding protein [Micromonospora sp. HM5-17]|jgi:ABC-2 type transport system ATP-binding protein|uniref:ABC transporter ATP-binding protein n=1 Tax=Micromonospora sp. HM5-17 TaxID=2487710 RepID=UPI000F4A0B2B|nr:ATP-binding cassette domain-containing protein [Micromonospora sp. HM5-17]ROT27256.1 ATP-binding cassette domain-containing protein [Micromonospora sp. HM5-17]
MLRVSSVNRTFGDRRVLDDISFEVAPGRMTGFVGANGAGKTTSMRIILGLLTADSGEVTWHGGPVTRAVRQRFGYMPEERGLYPKMKVREQLIYLGRLYGLSAPAARRSVDDLLERVGLTERADDMLETLSLGNQQRAQVAAALVHDPELLILDEPFSGLDPIALDAVAAVLRERAADGVPVLFSSHQLDVVERLCDDLVIIANGAVRAAGSRTELRTRYANPRYELVVDGDAGWVRDLPGFTVVDLDGPRVVVDLADPADGQRLLRAALDRGPVRTFAPIVPSLAEIFQEVTQ